MQRPQKRKSTKPRTGPNVKWSGFRPLYDFWGHEMKRHYQLETLANATSGLIERGDSFITDSARQVLGGGPIAAINFELFQEGRYQLIFRMHAVTALKKSASFGFVAAKNHEEASKVARSEHMNLQKLHARAPHNVVRPYEGGIVFLPDRHGRPGHGRPLYAYVTQWLNGFDELGVNQNLQFIVNVQKRHTFTIAETNALKTQMIEIITRTYDPASRTCMSMPEIASGDFVVRKTRQNGGELRLIACRRLLTNLGPAKLVARMVEASWKWGEREFELRPDEPAQFLDGLKAALGEEEAAKWVRAFDNARRTGRVPGRRDPYADDLVALVTG